MTADDHTREAAALLAAYAAEQHRLVPELTPGSIEYQRGPTALAMCSGEAWRYLGRSDELAGLDGYGHPPADPVTGAAS